MPPIFQTSSDTPAGIVLWLLEKLLGVPFRQQSHEGKSSSTVLCYFQCASDPILLIRRVLAWTPKKIPSAFNNGSFVLILPTRSNRITSEDLPSSGLKTASARSQRQLNTQPVGAINFSLRLQPTTVCN